MSEKGAHSFSVYSLSRYSFISSVMHALLPHHLEAVLLPQADDGELGVDLHSSDLEDLAECAEWRFNHFTQSAIAQPHHEGFHLQRVMHHELGHPPLRWPLWVV